MKNYYLAISKILSIILLFSVTSVSFAQNRTLLKGQDAKRINQDFNKILLDEDNIIQFIEFEENVSFESSVDLASKLGLSQKNRFEITNQFKSARDQVSVFRLQQVYDNIMVMGGNYTVQERKGQATTANGTYFRVNNLSKSVSISETDALKIALSEVNAESYMWEKEINEALIKKEQNDEMATFRPSVKLVFASEQYKLSSELRLAYQIEIYAQKPLGRYRIEVDARSGQIINKYNLLHTQSVEGTGVSLYNGEVNINLSQDGNDYLLQDVDRGQGINTYDMQNGVDYGNAVSFTEGDTFFDEEENRTGVSAHFGAAATYDYFLSNFGLNSFDGNGAAINSYVHFDFDFVNAFWDGQRMTYGDGNGSSITPLTTVDIIGHEIAHAVTQYSADLIYQYESGALNESFSDIFGQSIEFEAVPETANWNLGDEIFTNGVDMIRSMSAPNSQGQPDTYLGDMWFEGSDDNGGVHYNSGVQNFWFYLLVEGGTGTNDFGESYQVPAIGLEKAQQIAFRNLFFYLNQNSQYIDARFGSEMAAVDLYGENSPEYQAVRAAWDGVGVPSMDPEIEVADDIDFGKAVLAETTLTIPVKNNGLANLNISDLSIDNNDFSLPETPIEITENETFDLELDYNPVSLGVHTAILTISNNDTDKQISLTIEVVEDPVYSVSTEQLDVELLAGGSQSEEVIIQNDNDYDLIFEIETVSNVSTSASYIPTGTELKDGKVEFPLYKKLAERSSSEEDSIAGGYSWTDAVSYDWYDIQSVGTEVALSDDSNSDFVSMGFNFPFFEETFDQVSIGSNGWISFTNSSGSIWNNPLPSSSAPENVVAIMASDLHPDAGSAHYYYDEANTRFIIQFTEWSSYSDRTDSFDMQIHLYDNGKIKLLYDKISGARASAVGIQDGNREQGLTVAYNDPEFFSEGYAVEIGKGSSIGNWLSLSEASILVPANSSASFTAEINSEGLVGGDYQSDIVLDLEEFQTPSDVINVFLTVVGSPNLEETDIDLGQFLVNENVVKDFYLTNIGNETLEITNLALETANSGISFNLTDSSIAPYDSVMLSFELSIDVIGDVSNSLLVTSNDTENEITSLPISGEVINPPDVSYDPSEINLDLSAGQTLTEIISVENLVNYDLDLRLEVSQTANKSSFYQRIDGEYNTVGKVEMPSFRKLDAPQIGKNDDDVTGGYEFLDTNNGLSYNWFDIQNQGTSVNLSDDSNSGSIPLGFNFEFFEQTFNTINIGSNGWLSFTNQSGSIWSTPLPSTSAPENVIAVLAADLFPGQGSTHYYFDQAQNRFIVQYTGYSYCCSDEDLFTMQAQIYSNGDIIILYDEVNTNAFGTVGIQNDDQSKGLTVAYDEEDRIVSGYGVKIFRGSNWLSLPAPNLNLAASSSSDLEVDINTEGLIAGTYSAEILVSELEFNTDLTSIPVTIEVSGASLFEVESDQIDFDEVIVNAEKTIELIINNRGNDVLAVDMSSEEESISFGESSLSIDAFQSGVASITLSPTEVGDINSEIVFETNDPDNPEVVLDLIGKGVNAPTASVSKEEIVVVMEEGEEVSESFTISNAVNSAALNYNIAIELESDENARSGTENIPLDFYAKGNETSAGVRDLDDFDFSASSFMLSNNSDIILDTLMNIPLNSTGAVNVNGKIYATNYNSGQLVRYNPQTEVIEETFEIHAQPYGITYDGNTLWIGQQESSAVRGYDLSGNAVGSFDLPFSSIFPALTFNGDHILASQALVETTFELYALRIDGTVANTYTIANSDSKIVSQILFDNDNFWLINFANELNELEHYSFDSGEIEFVEYYYTGIGIEVYSLARYQNELLALPFIELGYLVEDGLSGWLSADPRSGTVDGNSSATIQLNFNSSGLEEGVHRAKVLVNSDDPNKSVIELSAVLSIGNFPPEAVQTMEDISMMMNDTVMHQMDLNNYFTDDGTNDLQFEVESSSDSVVNMAMDGSMLTLTPAGIGEVEIMISAFDGELYGRASFMMTVEEVLSIDNPFLDMQIFPNPTNGLISVKSNKLLKISIFDMQGRYVPVNVTKADTGYEVDLSSVVEGLYLIKVKNENNQEYSSKIIKN